MNLDEMKDRWAEYDRKLDATIRFNTEVLRVSAFGRAGSALARLSFWLWLELAINAVVAGLVGMFIGDYWRQVEFLVPALALQIGAILLIIACIRQLETIASLDYSEPVVASQKKLEHLRIVRIRATKWTIFAGPLLWTPLFIVAFQGLFGVNVYRTFDPAWLVANFAFGVAVIPLLVWTSKRFAERFAGSPFLQRLMDDVAGRNLTAARSFLGALAQFEAE